MMCGRCVYSRLRVQYIFLRFVVVELIKSLYLLPSLLCSALLGRTHSSLLLWTLRLRLSMFSERKEKKRNERRESQREGAREREREILFSFVEIRDTSSAVSRYSHVYVPAHVHIG